MSNDEQAVIARIADAWNNPGPHPAYHRKMQQRLLRDWPTLGRAVKRWAVEEQERRRGEQR